MKEQFETLKSLTNFYPNFNSCSGYSELNSVLNKFTQLLNYFNSYNDDYKRATTVYYNDISSIRENIQHSLYAASQDEKVKAFENAGKELRSNIRALAALVKPREEMAMA